MTTMEELDLRHPGAPPTHRSDAPRTASAAYLNGRQWTYCSPSYRALGHSFCVRSDDPEVGEYVDAIFEEFRTDETAAVTYSLMDRRPRRNAAYVLYADASRIGIGRSRSRLLATLLWHVNQEVVRRTGTDHVQWHASAAVRDGICVVMPAPMESGKTTTVAGLLRRGYQYLTDETVAVDGETLLVQPFPKALSIDRGSWAVLPELEPRFRLVDDQWQVPPGSIRQDVVAQPVRARLIIAPRFQREAQTVLRPLRRAEALVLVAQSTFRFREDPARNMTVSARVVAGCDCYELVIGDLELAVDRIDQLVDDVLREST